MSTLNWEVKTLHQLAGSQLFDVMQLRVNVFVVEQQCVYPELDEKDRDAETRHIIGLKIPRGQPIIPQCLFWAPLKTVLFCDCGVSLVLPASGAHKHGALRTVRPHVFAHTLRFSAHAFLPLTKKSWFLEVPFCYF